MERHYFRVSSSFTLYGFRIIYILFHYLFTLEPRAIWCTQQNIYTHTTFFDITLCALNFPHTFIVSSNHFGILSLTTRVVRFSCCAREVFFRHNLQNRSKRCENSNMENSSRLVALVHGGHHIVSALNGGVQIALVSFL